jgi:exonuclease III
MVCVCVCVPTNIQFYTINLDQYNKEKDLEICALKLNILSNSFTIICIYRSPTGNFSYFLKQLESILKKIYRTSNELILCGDLNINDLNDNSRKDLLDSLLASFNLFSTAKFPTTISNNSCTLMDNIYINTYRREFSVHPLLMVCQTMMLRLFPYQIFSFLSPDMYFPSPEKLTPT